MGSKFTYRLINPYVTGSLNNVVRSGDSFRAGKKFYKNLSNYFTNKVDEFYMTIQNIETGKLSHIKVNEDVKNTSSDPLVVDFNIERINNDFSPDLEKKIIEKYNELNNQNGGKRHHKRRHSNNSSDSSSDSSSSDTSSSSDESLVFPISSYKYFLLPYTNLIKTSGLSPMDYSRIFVPTFSFMVNPSIEIIYDIYTY